MIYGLSSLMFVSIFLTMIGFLVLLLSLSFRTANNTHQNSNDLSIEEAVSELDQQFEYAENNPRSNTFRRAEEALQQTIQLSDETDVVFDDAEAYTERLDTLEATVAQQQDESLDLDEVNEILSELAMASLIIFVVLAGVVSSLYGLDRLDDIRRDGLYPVLLPKSKPINRLIKQLPTLSKLKRNKQYKKGPYTPRMNQRQDVWNNVTVLDTESGVWSDVQNKYVSIPHIKIETVNKEKTFDLSQALFIESVYVLRSVLLHVSYHKRYDDFVYHMLEEPHNARVIATLINTVSYNDWDTYIAEDNVKKSDVIQRLHQNINTLIVDIINKINQLDDLEQKTIDNLRKQQELEEKRRKQQDAQGFLDEVAQLDNVSFDYHNVDISAIIDNTSEYDYTDDLSRFNETHDTRQNS